MTSSVRLCFLVLALFGLTCRSGAQAPVSDSLQGRIRDCAAVKVDGERLACFDKVATSVAAGTAREVASAPPAPDPVTAKVAALRGLGTGELLIELDNGQSWRTIAEDSRLLLKVGDPVTISRGAFGSFRLATPGNRFARVTRVR
jgi:hypothetical protein